MQRFLPIVLVAALLLTSSVAHAVHDAPEGVPADYEEALAPYGSWVEGTPYGRAWHPVVSYGWRPYVEGYWAWTSYGWTWVSFEPWAWTFHYGRWGFVPGIGWCWVPGFVYAPAWVDWYWGHGVVGWAPLPPIGARVAVFDHFVFVHDRDFCSPHLRTVVLRHDRLPHRIVRGWRGRPHHPPAIHHIERVARHPVVRVNRPPRHFAPRGDRRPGVERGAPRPHAPHGRQRLDRADRPHRPPSVGSAPVPRGRDWTHVARPPLDGARLRPGPAPRPPLLSHRGADPIVPRTRLTPEQGHGRRGAVAPPSPPPGVTVNPRAGRLAPGAAHGRPAARHHGRGGARGHVAPGGAPHSP